MVDHENVWQSFINEIGEPRAQAHFVALAALAMAMYRNSTASAKLGRVGLGHKSTLDPLQIPFPPGIWESFASH